MKNTKRPKTVVYILFMVIIFVLFSTACTSSEPKKPETTPTVETVSPSEKATLATVKIVEATDELLVKYTDYDEIDVATDEYGIRLILTTDSPVENLRLFTLAYEEATEGMVEADGGELYQQGEFTPEKPLVLSVSFPGTLPPVGIEFTDTDGTIRRYDIYMSGMDGSIQLEETQSTKE